MPAKNGDGFADQMPPNDKRAERALLGSVLRLNACLDEVVLIVSDPESFYEPAHRLVYGSMLAMRDAGKPIDLVTLSEHMKRRPAKEWQVIEEAGGYAYLSGFWDEAPSAANAEEYAKIVRDMALLRAILHAGQDAMRAALHPSGPADEILRAVESDVFAIAERGTIGKTFTLEQCVNHAFDAIDARKSIGIGHATIDGIGTGYLDWDSKTSGMHPAELIVMAARPSVGKTALAINVARNVAVQGEETVFLVSLEQSRHQIAERLLCCQARVDSHKMRTNYLSADEHGKLQDAAGPLRKAKIHLDDAPGQTVGRIAANARRIKRRHGLGLVVIDYLQLVEPDRRGERREQEVSFVSRRLKGMAKELEVPVIVCAQLNRQVEQRSEPRPRLADLRESGSIEMDADTVILLWRENNDLQSEITCDLAKQREGPVGSFKLTFLREFQRFENYCPATSQARGWA